MSLSVEGVRPVSGAMSVSYIQPRPNAYQIENQSEVSDSYRQTQAVTPQDAVGAARPVRYANTDMAAQRASRMEESQRANKAYNDLVGSFGSKVSGYDSGLGATSYEVVGSNIDLFV